MSNKITDKDYLFLSAMLRARQASLLTQERLEQMLAASGPAEAAKQLLEYGWPDMSEMSSPEISRALAEHREALFTEIERVIPEKDIVRAFRLKYDYHNAKAIVKGEGADIAIDEMVSTVGNVSAEQLQRAFHERDFRFLSGELGSAMNEAKSVLARTGNPQLADFIFDKAYFADMKALAAGVADPFLAEYVTMLIDCANLRSSVRCMRMGKNADFLRTALIPGGTVSEERLLQNVFAGEGIASLYATTALKEAAAMGAEAVKGGPMTAFERECDNAVNGFLRGARMTGFGSPLAVGYLSAEENSITAIRMILTGLKAGIAPERLRERLRDTYV